MLTQHNSTTLDILQYKGDELIELQLNGVTVWSGYLVFTELEDGTYSVKAREGATLPSELVIPSTYNGEKVTVIPDEGFSICGDITSVVISDNIESIGSHAFYCCSSFTKVVIGSGVKTIGTYAFFLCKQLTDVYYKGTAEMWGKIKVSSVSNDDLTEATRYYYSETKPSEEGNYWRYVDGKPVVWCYHKTVVIDEAVDATCTETGLTEGSHCSDCGEVLVAQEVIPMLDHKWSNWTLDETTGLEYGKCEACDIYTVRAGSGVEGDIVIPATYNGKPVTSIADNAFLFRNGITSVLIANGITSIGASAFADCAKITRVEMPDSVTSIGNYAFSKCPKLTTAVIPNGVSVIANGLFMNCRNLIGVNIPQGTTYIGNNAFYGCHSIVEVEIPDSVTSIGEYAFGDCLSITRIVIPSSVTRIGEGAFDLCNSLTYLYIGANVKKIGHSAFRGCSNLSIEVDENNRYYRMRDGCLWEINTSTILYGEVEEIPDETAAIGDGAFYGNTFFAPIRIPLSVKTIGSLAFGGKPVTVYCAASSKPADWADDWCDDSVTVVWGYKEEDDVCSHEYGGWITTVLPTCTKFGSMKRTCSICGGVDVEVIEPLGHISSDWIIDIQPTTETEGSKHKECTRCGEVLETATIPKLGVEDTNIYLVTESGEFLTDEQGNLLII